MSSERAVTTAPTSYARALFLTQGLGTLGLATFAPGSTTSVLVERAGYVGDLAKIVFAAAVLVLLLDWLVNDVMPERFKLPKARDFRWLCVCSMAIVYWLFGTLALLPGWPKGAWVLIALYFANGAWGMSFAWHTKMAWYRASMQAAS